MNVDPIEFDLVRGALSTLCDEMALTMSRAAFSPGIRESMDYTTAILTTDSQVIAQGRTHALHLGSIMPALQAVIAKYGDNMRPGDVFINNDPYEGGSHLPDLFVLKPIFHLGRIVAFSGAEGHMSDMGGKNPGSNAADCTEIYQEGLRIPPSRLFTEGKPNETLWDLLERNVRDSHRVLGDLRAVLAAVQRGEAGYLTLCEEWGLERLQSISSEIMDHTERVARHAISAWPKGRFSFTDHIDDDGLGTGSRSRSRFAATRSTSISTAAPRRSAAGSTRRSPSRRPRRTWRFGARSRRTCPTTPASLGP
jgi:N-methylhydantoinase B